jgi:hypothetical protein
MHNARGVWGRVVADVLGCFRRVRKIAKSDYYLRHVRLSVRLSAWNNSAPTGRILMKLDIEPFRKSVENIQVTLKSYKNNGYFI